jgi:hypothetical protein
MRGHARGRHHVVDLRSRSRWVHVRKARLSASGVSLRHYVVGTGPDDDAASVAGGSVLPGSSRNGG